jgi:Fe-S oxidoreductase
MGYRVVLPAGQVCCGLTWHSTGQLDMAKRIITQTLDSLGPALDANMPIIGLEPSCTVMLSDEITELLPDDPRASKLASQVVTLADIVAAHQGPWPFGEINIKAISQVHCHQEAKGSYDPDKAVLQKLGVDTDIIGSGCCGLAGNFGFEPGHWDVSQALGERELFPKVRGKDGDTIVLADGFSCRTQVTQGTGADASHLAEVLKLALDQKIVHE